jgi:hypothetical protein
MRGVAPFAGGSVNQKQASRKCGRRVRRIAAVHPPSARYASIASSPSFANTSARA